MTQRHGETEKPLEGFDLRIERGFEWIEDHARTVVIAIVGMLLLGGGVALGYELLQRQADASQGALDRVERRYLEAMGQDSSALYVTEPANRDQAAEARREALAGYDGVSADYTGSLADHAAQVRAAEVEIDLGDFEAAQQRLALAAGEMEADHTLRGAALRLQGYAFEELERWPDAAAAYAAGGAVEAYPAREALWLAAGENYLRAGDSAAAALAFEEVIVLAPAWAERQGLVERLAGLQVRAEAPAPDAAATGQTD